MPPNGVTGRGAPARRPRDCCPLLPLLARRLWGGVIPTRVVLEGRLPLVSDDNSGAAASAISDAASVGTEDEALSGAEASAAAVLSPLSIDPRLLMLFFMGNLVGVSGVCGGATTCMMHSTSEGSRKVSVDDTLDLVTTVSKLSSHAASRIMASSAGSVASLARLHTSASSMSDVKKASRLIAFALPMPSSCQSSRAQSMARSVSHTAGTSALYSSVLSAT